MATNGEDGANGLVSAEDHLRYVAAHRDDVALVFWTLTENGEPDAARPLLRHHADELMPLASTVKIVVLAAYAREIASGRWNAEEQVAVSDWERWYLPGTDGGAHSAALRKLALENDRRGYAKDSTQRVPLDEIASATIRFSDNAATDYLLDRLGSKRIAETLRAADLPSHEPIPPLLGVILAWRNHESPDENDERIDLLARLGAAAWHAEAFRLATAWDDDAWRQKELHWREHERTIERLEFEARAAARLSVKGSAEQYARLMSQVASDRFLSVETSGVMRRHLEWPLAIGDNAERFERFGTKGGTLLGILTEASYVRVRDNTDGKPSSVVVLFHRKMPLPAWVRLTKTYAQQQFIVRVATDETFASAVVDTLDDANEPRD